LLLVGSIAVLGLVGCGSDGDTTENDATTSAPDDGPTATTTGGAGSAVDALGS